MFGFNKKDKEKFTLPVDADEHEMTDEEMENVSSLGVSDFARYLTDEETRQIITSSKNSAEAMYKMQTIVAERKNQEPYVYEESKRRSR